MAVRHGESVGDFNRPQVLTFKPGPDDPTMGRLYSNSFFSLSADGKLLAFGGWPKQPKKDAGKAERTQEVAATVWDVEKNERVVRVAVDYLGPLYPLLSQDGKTLATWSIQYGYWRPPSRKPGNLEPAHHPGSPDPTKVLRLWDVATGKLISQARMSSSNPSSVVFSPDGQTIAASTWDGLIERWDTHTGEPKPHLHGRDDRGQRLAFSTGREDSGRSWYRWCRPEVGHDRRSIAR